MRKSKVLKALLVFGMSVATATSVAVTAGCGHTHTYDENEWGKDGSKHWRVATCEEHPGEKFDEADHVDENNDKECDVCGGAISSGTTPGGTTPGGTPDSHTHTWSTTYDADHADANGHWHWCTAGDDCDETDVKNGEEAHVDTNGDNTCDTCGYNGGALPAGYTGLASKEGVTKLVANSFLVSGKLAQFTDWGTAGVYSGYSKEAGAATNYAEVKDGKVNLVTDTSSSACLYVDFGAIGDAVIEGYAELSDFSGTLNGYTPVQFYGNYKSNTSADANREKTEVFGLRANNDWQYRIATDVSSTYTTVTPTVKEAVANGSLYFKYDSTTQKITIKINNSVIADEVSVPTDGIKGIRFTSGDGNTKTFNIDNLIVVSTPVTLDAYKETVTTNVGELETSANTLKVDSAWTLNDETTGTAKLIAEAKATVTAAIAATNATKESIDTAYAAYETAVISALKAEYKARVVAAFPATDYDRDTATEAAYAERLVAANAVIDEVNNISGFTSAYTSACAKFDDLENDTLAATADVIIKVNDGINDVATLNKKANDTVTVDMIREAITVPSGKQIEGLYSDSAMQTALTSVNTAVTVDTTITVYVKFEDKVLTNQDYRATAVLAKTTEETEIIDGIMWLSTGVEIDANKKTAGGVECTHRIKTGAGFAFTDGVASAAIKFNIESAAKITVYALSSSSSAARDLALYDVNGVQTSQKTSIDGKTVTTAEYNITESGIFYLGSTSGGINLYRIVIEYNVAA